MAVSAGEIMDLIAKLQLNAFGLSSRGSEGGQVFGMLVFEEMSFFNHSCAPNTVMEVIDDCQYLFAKHPIGIDDEVYAHYIPLDQPLAVRRTVLSDSFGFECRCRRCNAEEVTSRKTKREAKHGRRAREVATTSQAERTRKDERRRQKTGIHDPLPQGPTLPDSTSQGQNACQHLPLATHRRGDVASPCLILVQ